MHDLALVFQLLTNGLMALFIGVMGIGTAGGLIWYDVETGKPEAILYQEYLKNSANTFEKTLPEGLGPIFGSKGYGGSFGIGIGEPLLSGDLRFSAPGGNPNTEFGFSLRSTLTSNMAAAGISADYRWFLLRARQKGCFLGAYAAADVVGDTAAQSMGLHLVGGYEVGYRLDFFPFQVTFVWKGGMFGKYFSSPSSLLREKLAIESVFGVEAGERW